MSTEQKRQTGTAADGVRAMVPRERMTPSARKLRDYYTITPGAPLFQKEFGYYCLDEWRAQGMPQDVPFAELFGYDPPGDYGIGGLGWCEAAFLPAFEERVVEDRGEYEVVQDYAGRHLLCFKGRRDGFMPEYLDHPVKDMKTWEEGVKWRLAPETPGRFDTLEGQMAEARAAAAEGKVIVQHVIGGYMYLRSLIGPMDLLYAFHDQPALVHDCMQTWLTLAEIVVAKHQQHLTLDQIFFGEDICYKVGPLISPAMIREFLFPYYQQLISNTRSRQIDVSRHLSVHLDTDGYAPSVIPLYQEIGMDVMSPFEVAAGCDVVAIGRQYPRLVMSGGIDKRVLATTPAKIDAYLERVVVPMRERGGYTPTSDHGVPAEVSYSNYLHYRKRMKELGG